MTSPARDLDPQAILDIVLGPVLGGACGELRREVDFDIPQADQQPWVQFIEWTNTRPPFVARWRADERQERRCYARLVDAIDASRSAYVGAIYHLDRVRTIEMKVREILSGYDFHSALPKGSSAAIGRCRQADFEYQAFIFAYRRSLEYLAWGLSTYFAAETDSFKKFGRVGTWKPEPVAQAMAASYSRHIDKFEFALSAERGRSVRDRLAHKEFIPAFHVNVGPFGYRLFTLEAGMRPETRSLTDLLEERIQNLHACITDMLSTFRIAVLAHEGAGTFGTAGPAV